MDSRDVHEALDALWAPRSGLGDPRLCLLAAGLATLLLLVLSPAGASLLAVVLTAGALVAGGPGLRKFLRITVILCLITLALNAVTAPGPALARLGPLTVTAPGVAAGLARAARLLGLAAVARLVTRALPASDLADLAERLSWPLERRFGFARGLGLAFGLALRFIPELGAEAARIRLAQAARPPQAPAGRRRRLESTFLPLLAGAVRRSEEVALTLDARGFASGEPTRRAAVGLGRSGLVATLLLLGLTALIILADRALGSGG